MDVTDLVPWYIYIESSPFAFPNRVIVRFFKIRPEFLMLKSVPGEIQHAGKCGVSNLRCKPTDHVHIQNSEFLPFRKTHLGSSSKQYCTPWPWCISQSTINTLKKIHTDVTIQYIDLNEEVFRELIFLIVARINSYITFQPHIFAGRI